MSASHTHRCQCASSCLLDDDEVTPYVTHPSPVRSAIFDAGETSRINVAHFMIALITEGPLWDQWKGQMP